MNFSIKLILFGLLCNLSLGSFCLYSFLNNHNFLYLFGLYFIGASVWCVVMVKRLLKIHREMKASYSGYNYKGV